MCHVLIIEDEWLVADYVEQLARDAGATSVENADCECDAVEAARKRKPEIILSDVNLRTGTGPRAVEAILAECGPIPVIFITGTPEDCTPCECPAVILNKPIEAQRFARTFKELAPVA